jgi:outer membrane protein assembly factor BamE (lipoprotein component of BamABCDE complex)
MSARKKKILCITALLIIAAAAVVLCANCFTARRADEYDGTLVDRYHDALMIQEGV